MTLSDDKDAIGWTRFGTNNDCIVVHEKPSIFISYGGRERTEFFETIYSCLFESPCIGGRFYENFTVSDIARQTSTMAGNFNTVHECGTYAYQTYSTAWAVLTGRQEDKTYKCYVVTSRASTGEEVISKPGVQLCFLKGRSRSPEDYGYKIPGVFITGVRANNLKDLTKEVETFSSLTFDCVRAILKSRYDRKVLLGYMILHKPDGNVCVASYSRHFYIDLEEPSVKSAMCIFENALLP